eukprot:gb/GECG01004815.1/.p1 GENE.gb/GECG01004815.1/~~gb/GECG01004815.1/.p1  ORF type:complete len:402 (+),score=28.80 gb/GECG01004815.1/:1-1206(+)
MSSAHSISDVIVLEIGAAHTIVGFAEEPHYRYIVDSPLCLDSTAYRPKPIQGNDRSYGRTEGKSHQKGLLRGYQRAIIPWLRFIFLDMLDIRPQEHRIVIVVDDAARRDTLLAVLQLCIHEFDMKGAQIVPSAVAIMSVSGFTTGLVVDVGYRETRVIPVYEGSVAPERIERIACGSFDCICTLDKKPVRTSIVQSDTSVEEDVFLNVEETAARAHQYQYAYSDRGFTRLYEKTYCREGSSATVDNWSPADLGNAIGDAVQSCLRTHSALEVRSVLSNIVLNGYLNSLPASSNAIKECIYAATFEHNSLETEEVQLSAGISPLFNAYYGAVILVRSGRSPKSLFSRTNIPMPEYYDPETWQEGLLEFTRSHRLRAGCEHNINPLDDSGVFSLTDLLYRRQM